MIKSSFFIGEPFEFQNNIFIYPPKVKDIVGNKFFPIYKKILTTSQEDLEDEYTKNSNSKNIPTPLEFLLNNAFNNVQLQELTKEAFKFFIHQEVTFLFKEKMIILGNIKKILTKAKTVNDLIKIDETNFFEFQNLIRQSVNEKIVEPPNPNEHWKIKQMKAKARYRDRIKAKQASSGLNLHTTLTAICCMKIGITPLNIGEMSYTAVPALMKMYQEQEKFQIDIQSKLAGSKKVKPQYWIRNIED